MPSELTDSPSALIFTLSVVLSGAVVIAAFVAGNPFWISLLISVGFIACGALVAKTQPAISEVGAAAALIGQAIALTTAFQGHPWQLDTHMLFFALLACLVILRSVPALLVATAITAVHHLSLTIFIPSLVYPGGGLAENLGRTVFHAVIVLMETAALSITVLRLKKLDDEMELQHQELEASLTAAEEARETSIAAKYEAQTLQKQAEEATSRTEKLLEDVKLAAQEREIATQERAQAQIESARQQEVIATEQAEVVGALKDALNRLKEGDLTVRILATMPPAYDGLRISFNAATDALENMVAEVSQQSEAIENEVQEVAAAAADLATRTERQAMTLSQATEDLEGLTRKVQKAVEAVEEANTSAMLAKSNANFSERIVTEASDVMTSVQSRAAEMSKIVQVIDDISFQTNLLALNAGVEAARAGEAGRGFAVVASEVRALAQRSSDSAASIRSLIESSGSEVEKGSAKISETVSSLGQVLQAVFEITGKTEFIKSSSHNQKTAVEDLNSKISVLDITTQKNAAMFEETSAACASLLQGARALRALTHNFNVSQRSGKHIEAA